MTDPEYRARPSAVRGEQTFRLAHGALIRETPNGAQASLPYAEIRAVRLYRSPGMGSMAPAFLRCTLRPRKGRAVVLSSNHFAGFGKFEDRSATFRPFVETLLQRLAVANPQTAFRAGMPPVLWWSWAVLLAITVIVVPLLVVLIAVDLADGRGIDAPLVAVLGVLLVVFFGTFGYVRDLRRNRSRRFDPRSENPLDAI
jgi:hypothetical protein